MNGNRPTIESVHPVMLIIADDLTGANDAGVQFAATGVRSLVFVHHAMERLPDSHPVIVINTESRHVAPEEAAARVRKAAELGMRAGVACFYKKTDSTLRGNIAAELNALLSATGANCIPFVPALPDLGRTTKDGVHFVHGIPLSETVFARDPLNPIRHSRVTEILAEQTNRPIRTGQQVENGMEGIAVLDCTSAEDLAKIARQLAAANRLRVVSGSVGLAKYLVEYLNIRSDPPDIAKAMGAVLLVNGSVNERALEQIERAAGHFSEICLTPENLLGERAQLSIPSGGGNVLLHSISRRSDLEKYETAGRSAGITENELHLQVAERTGRIVRQILTAEVFRTVVVFGGDTLGGIARANHWREIEPLMEIEPGVSVSVPVGSGLTLISKAGGFGDADVVSRILHFVDERSAKSADV